jgi:hypothetical protein
MTPSFFESAAEIAPVRLEVEVLRETSPLPAKKHGAILDGRSVQKCRAILAGCEVVHSARNNRGESRLVVFAK